MLVKPPGPRHTLTTLPDGVSIAIAARRRIFVLLFLPLWLCGWALGEVSAARSLAGAPGELHAPDAFLAVWLAVWTLGGGFALFILLWQLSGREVVTLSPTVLQIRYEIFGLGVSRRYDLSQVRYLRVTPMPFNLYDYRMFWGVVGGTIAFDYGSRTFRFGGGLDEAEARVVLQALADRSPVLNAA